MKYYIIYFVQVAWLFASLNWINQRTVHSSQMATVAVLVAIAISFINLVLWSMK